ncbi:hypothetical protein F4679DRAFT_370488 [Xylaria curta]|nr:hypothetical protein F4679DRAFT_370488 [Xylaria curta]
MSSVPSTCLIFVFWYLELASTVVFTGFVYSRRECIRVIQIKLQMSIQKIAASLASLNQETNIGLVHFNFDFALKKVDAPHEFQGLGRELSQARIKAAEDGAVHITARKLGALFRQCLPSTPHLIKAYGTRASIIASDPKVNPKPSKKHGVLADHVGIDGTSIWAAATSGAESIAVHLLACMLARMWSRSEAIAIWAELVSERKKELERTDVADSQHLMALNDSRIDIARDQLAQWDSSARAWLQSADEAMKIKQTQLMLVLDNINLPVNIKPTLYHNVIQAWTSAMLATENLIRGVPQSVENGSILLGLSSWHIYPDMVVLQSSTTPVRQADPLVNDAGILTIGLNTKQPSKTGVSWSLPLGQLRYYGGAVVSEKSLVTQGNRITVTQLIQLSIGCMTRHWGVSELDIVQLIVNLWKLIEPIAGEAADGTSYWLGHLAEAVKPLLNQNSLDSQVGFRLMKLGARRCPNFLGSDETVGKPMVNQNIDTASPTVPKLFGLSDINIFASLLSQPESCVDYFRELVQDPLLSHFNNRLLLIRYKKIYAEDDYGWEYATALPVQGESRKRSHDGQEHILLNPPRHIRWIGFRSGEGRFRDLRTQGEDCFATMTEIIRDKTIRWKGHRNDFINCGILHHVTSQRRIFQDGLLDIYSHASDLGRAGFDDFIHLGDYNSIVSDDDGVDVHADHPSHYDNSHGNDSPEHMGFCDLAPDPGPAWCDIDFEVVTGSMDTVALVVTTRGEHLGTENNPNLALSSPALSGAISDKKNIVSREKALLHLNQLVNTTTRATLLRSLRALATVWSIYSQLPNSTISLSIISHCLPEMAWIPTENKSWFRRDVPKFRPFQLNRSSTFSCLLLLETGSLSVPSTAIPNVMAMATGNSIYIAKSLISDPSMECLTHEICRIKGSIGKPGIALMVPPKNPLIREMDLSNWQCVNHSAFDGKLHDAFSSTTLHLRFTDYIFPIDIGNHGSRDFEVYFLESLVSVHDRGEWVADLDVLRTLEQDITWTIGDKSHWKQPMLTSVARCEHVRHANVGSMEGTQCSDLIAIDDWNEILDPPSTISIVRSLDNWLGRLSAAVVCRQLGFLVMILPGKVCWPCIRNEWFRLSTHPILHLEPKQAMPNPRLPDPTPPSKWELQLDTEEEEDLIEVMVNGVRQLRRPDDVKNNMMGQGKIFLIC